MRIDIYMVEQGLALSRTQAQELIAAGQVFQVTADGVRNAVHKPSLKVPSDGTPLKIEIDRGGTADKFVSRGGRKLDAALVHTRYNALGKRVLDIGLSTGGFTDCVLQKGAAQVVGVDVGHEQLSTKLRGEPRLKHIEGLNARFLDHDENRKAILALTEGQLFDLIVIDVSFISLALILPATLAFLSNNGQLLALVKPQFEVGREKLAKNRTRNGIVKDPELWLEVEKKIRAAAVAAGFKVEDYFESAITGGDGNQEFFLYAVQADTSDNRPERVSKRS